MRSVMNQGRVAQVAVAVVGLICLAFPANYVWRVCSARSTYQWLAGLEARTYWDHDSHAPDEAELRAAQRWLASVIGAEFTSVVTSATIDASEADDAQLRRLSLLKSLTILRLHSDCCSDATLTRICQLDQLRELSLNCQQLTFEGLLELRKLKQLRTLKLASMTLTQGELAVLAAALPGIELDYTKDSQRYVRKAVERLPTMAIARDEEPRFETIFKTPQPHGGVLRPMAYRDSVYLNADAPVPSYNSVEHRSEISNSQSEQVNELDGTIAYIGRPA